MNNGPIVNCTSCGRDTTAIDQLCNRCSNNGHLVDENDLTNDIKSDSRWHRDMSDQDIHRLKEIGGRDFEIEQTVQDALRDQTGT